MHGKVRWLPGVTARPACEEVLMARIHDAGPGSQQGSGLGIHKLLILAKENFILSGFSYHCWF